MAIPKHIHDAKGSWKGKSQLNLPWLEPAKRVTESTSLFHVDIDSHNTFATITYNWEYEGKRQEGTMVLSMANKTKIVEIGWSDSWHMSSGVLHTTGTEDAAGSVKTKGSYAAGKETWGWTINFDMTGKELVMTMDNVHPDGQVDWAVKAVYRRD